jgi:hypothetical protein
MMRKLDLPRLLDRTVSRERDLALAMIASRLIAPGSKLATVRALAAETATSSLGRVLDLGVVEEREIYAALDWLGDQHDRIERALARRHHESFAQTLAETINGLYKTEVIRRRGPWRSIEAVEFATLEWVEWFNHRRLLEPIGNITPAEALPDPPASDHVPSYLAKRRHQLCMRVLSLADEFSRTWAPEFHQPRIGIVRALERELPGRFSYQRTP